MLTLPFVKREGSLKLNPQDLEPVSIDQPFANLAVVKEKRDKHGANCMTDPLWLMKQ